MAKYVHLNSAIECDSAEIISRDIRRSSILNIRNIGLCFTYKCSKNSEAKLLMELNPKNAIYCEESYLDLDDIIESENIYVLINKKKPYIPEKLNHTGRHKAQTFTSKEFTFAQITRQISGIPDLVPQKKITLK